jgi:hypothetical protein
VAECARDLLRVLLVAPEVRIGGALFEGGHLGLEAIDVHHLGDVVEGGAQGLDFGGKIEF